MATTLANRDTIERTWYHVDADGLVVGRLAVAIAPMLMGKNKPLYTPGVDCGDFIVVTNCEKVRFTGKKWDQKYYYRHTGYLGGLVEESAAKVRARFPDRILRAAVRRMLPKTKQGRQMLKKLKIYAGPEHPHVAQQPQELKI